MAATLSSVPRFSRLGSVIPSKVESTGAQFGAALEPFSDLFFSVFLNGSADSLAGEAKVYEDDGVTNDYYNKDDFSTLSMSYKYSGGDFKASLTSTGALPRSARVRIYGCPFTPDPAVTYDAKTMSCSFPLDSSARVAFSPLSVSGVAGLLSRAAAAKDLLDEAQETPGSMTGQQDTGGALTRMSSLGAVIKHAFEAGDATGFEDAVKGAKGMYNDARDEIIGLSARVDDCAKGRVTKALALLS